MPRGPTTFRKRDLDIALKAARDAGLKVARLEVDKCGKIVIVTAEQAAAEATSNEWDVVLEKGENRR